MVHTYDFSYSESVRLALESALSFHTPSSLQEAMTSERYLYPEVEDDTQTRPQPTLITSSSSQQECCLIEASCNSARVSLRLGQSETDCQGALKKMFFRFMMQKADRLDLLRRIPVAGYDVSLLVTARHLIEIGPEAVTDFICGFAKEVMREVEKLEGLVKSQGNATASELLRDLAF